MNDAIQTFPANAIEALAMLYVQNQDLSDLTPEAILDLYEHAYNKIKDYRRDKRNAARRTITF